jgi:hypothetical protein
MERVASTQLLSVARAGRRAKQLHVCRSDGDAHDADISLLSLRGVSHVLLHPL